MAIQSPLKLLEINIISAHDLPSVSKMLRTFAVAYVHPDHKLTTKIDHHGHTNPTWNYKVLFHVDEKFLKKESSAVTIEIYNLAWLRDLPIGTARLFINSLSPPLNKNPDFRRVALKICRPSGHLQGTLNLGVQLVDNTIPEENMCLFSLRNVEHIEMEQEEEIHDDKNQEGNNCYKEEDNNFQDQEKNPGETIITSRIDSVSTTPESRFTSQPGSEHETKISSNFSVTKPLPSEVADDLKKGIYATEWNEYGSSIFDNWTEHGNSKIDDLAMKPENLQWPTDELIPLTADRKSDCQRMKPEKLQWPTDELIPLTADKKSDCHRTWPSDKKKGLLSCFGNAYGFEFKIICGSNELKKKKNKMTKNKINRHVNQQNVHLMTIPDENLHRFYV